MVTAHKAAVIERLLDALVLAQQIVFGEEVFSVARPDPVPPSKDPEQGPSGYRYLPTIDAGGGVRWDPISMQALPSYVP